MIEVINQIISILMMPITIILGILILIAVYCLFAGIINAIFPTKLILLGLKKEERRDVRKALEYMSNRYKVLKKIQSGIYSDLPDYKRTGNYGFTRGAISIPLIFRTETFLRINFYGSSRGDIPQTYYDRAIHELTHTLTKIFSPNFREGRFRTIFLYDENAYKKNLTDFIDSTMKNNNLSTEDIRRYVSVYAKDPIETLSECMWLYLRFEEDEELRNKHQKDYEVVKIFITEFDKIYKMKTS